MVQKEIALRIEGLYFWGKGWTWEARDSFHELVRSFAEVHNLPIGKTQFGVYTHESKELYIYFHGMEVVFKGEDYTIWYDRFNDFITNSDLNVETSKQWEKVNGEHIK
jgi:hypothetical protein